MLAITPGITHNQGVQLARRGFLRLISALPAFAVFRSLPVQAAPVYRPYPVGDAVVAVDDAAWGGPYRVSLWDGDKFIKVVHPQHLGCGVIVPSWTRTGKIADTSFKITSAKMDEHGLHTIKAHYEYGPKWWKHSRQAEYAERSGALVRP